jgi:glutamine synthetase
MAKKPSDIIDFIKKNDVRMIDLVFVDVPGTWQHASVPAAAVDAGGRFRLLCPSGPRAGLTSSIPFPRRRNAAIRSRCRGFRGTSSVRIYAADRRTLPDSRVGG